MKRYIKPDNHINYEDVIIEDSIIIDIELPISQLIAASDTVDNTRFPGSDEFRKRVLDILQNEYHFDVEYDDYAKDSHGNPIHQQGWVSNRDDSDSIYFNVFYDLSNAPYAFKRLSATPPESIDPGLVYCFILFRFSDHPSNNLGDVDYRTFVRNNKNKHMSGRTDVVNTYEEHVKLDENLLQLHYEAALDQLRNAVDTRIMQWVRDAKLMKKYK